MVPMPRFAAPALLGSLILVVVGCYVYGAMHQLNHMNLDINANDQRSYIRYATRLVESHYSYVGDHNRMPVYPFLQSLFYRPGMSAETFFMRGKVVNLILSLALLLGLTLILLKIFGRSLHTLNLILIIAFTVFVFKASWFQAELLFYFVYFCLFLLLWRLLHTPSYSRAVVAGIVAGIAHLIKASVLPGLALFLVAMGAQWAWRTYRDRRTLTSRGVLQSAVRSLLTMLWVVLCFLLTVYPYISTSKRVFGHYFYNVNSTFYIWYDSWDDVMQGTRAHRDRVGWPDMPSEEIPSMSKYLREHTTEQILARFRNGARVVWSNMRDSYGYFKYLLIYTGLLALAGAWHWRRTRQLIAMHPVPFFFVPVYFAIQFLLCAWYAPIADGNRLILSQFVPLMFLLASGIHELLRAAPLKIGVRAVSALTTANVVVLAVVLIDVYLVLTERIGTVSGGL